MAFLLTVVASRSEKVNKKAWIKILHFKIEGLNNIIIKENTKISVYATPSTNQNYFQTIDHISYYLVTGSHNKIKS